MQEINHDGTDRLTEKATLAQLLAAAQRVQSGEIVSVGLYGPGSYITRRVGKRSMKFRVEEDGKLTRVHFQTLEPLSNV